MTRPIPVALHHTCFLVRDLEGAAQGMDMFDFGYFHFPEIGAFVEVLYLDATQLPAPEAVIQPSS